VGLGFAPEGAGSGALVGTGAGDETGAGGATGAGDATGAGGVSCARASVLQRMQPAKKAAAYGLRINATLFLLGG